MRDRTGQTAARGYALRGRAMVVLALVFATAILSSARASAQLYANPVTDRERPYQLNGYTVLPPPGSGWFEMKKDRDFVYFGKRLVSPTHSFIAIALSAPVGESFSSADLFREHVARQLSENTGDARSKVTVASVEVDAGAGPFCVRYRTTADDRGAANARGRSLLVETVGLSCLHTERRDLAVDVSYTERGLPGETGSRLRDEGESFIRSLKFTPRR
jgi:hypothetical protein